MADNPMGTITCDTCGRQWPCHFKEWLYGLKNPQPCSIKSCLGELTWSPTTKEPDGT